MDQTSHSQGVCVSIKKDWWHVEEQHDNADHHDHFLALSIVLPALPHISSDLVSVSSSLLISLATLRACLSLPPSFSFSVSISLSLSLSLSLCASVSRRVGRSVCLTLSIGRGSGWSEVTLPQTTLAPFLTVPSMRAAFSLRDRFSLSVRLRVLSLRRPSLYLLLVLLYTDWRAGTVWMAVRQAGTHSTEKEINDQQGRQACSDSNTACVCRCVRREPSLRPTLVPHEQPGGALLLCVGVFQGWTSRLN